MSDQNRAFSRLRPYGVFSDAGGSFRRSMIGNAARRTRSPLPSQMSPWPSMPIGLTQQAQILWTRRQILTRLLGDALSREKATLTLVEEKRQKCRSQSDFDRQRDHLRARIESARALLEVGNPPYMSIGYVRQRYKAYRQRHDALVADHRQDRAELEHAVEEHRQAVRDLESSRLRLQQEGPEEGPEEGEPQLILDNVEESAAEEGVSVDTPNFEFDNDEGM